MTEQCHQRDASTVLSCFYNQWGGVGTARKDEIRITIPFHALLLQFDHLKSITHN